MFRPKFIKPGESDPLYPSRNKDGTIETLINPNTDSALTNDRDSHSNFVYNRYHHLPIDSQRQKLPVFQYREHILYLLEKYQTLVLIGETGCGKSTQVPQYLHEIGHKVCVTQPRVTAAISLALRVREEAGECVGYAAGATSMRDENTSIVYMTEGVLLREMFASPLLMQYSCIMLDEVHERSLMTDVLMGLLKKIIKKRKNLKLIISSATIDAEFFRDYFNLTDKKKDNSSPTSVIMSMQGRTYPLNIFYSEEPVPDYVKATVDTVIKIHENEPFGDILAFLTSQEEIHTALETLQTYAEQNNSQTNLSHFQSGIKLSNINILPMYGSLPYYRQIKVFQTADHNVRKVILATNIAETSITIPGIVYVIDCGFHKLPYFDATPGVECVTVCPITKCNATQRAGRAARTKQGNCYRLYTEAEHEKLLPSVPPEMCRSDLSSILLQLKALGIHNLLRFSFPTPPPAKSLLAALETLYALNSIDKVGQLTEKGKMMAELPTGCMCAKMIVESGEYGCMDEILHICAMLQVDNVFIKSATGRDNINAKRVWRDNFEVAEGEILTYLNIFDSYQKVKNSVKDERKSLKICKDWCHKMYMNYRVMEKAFEIRKNLDKLVRHKFKIENKVYDGPDLGSGKCERIMRCVVSGYFPQAVSLSPYGDYRGARGAKLYYNGETQSKWLIYTSIQCTNDKVYMKDVLAIKKEWLLDIAPHYYKET